MDKKLTAGKLFGIIFCIIASAAACVLLGWSIYLGGQMKLVDRYLKAVAREDFSSYKQCFSEADAAKLNELNMAAERGLADTVIEDTEEIKMTADFCGREKLADGSYRVFFDMTIYNDDEHAKLENYSLLLDRDNGKWVIVTEE